MVSRVLPSSFLAAVVRAEHATLGFNRHKDGWQYRHFLDSPEQGLLLCYFYDDVLPQSGGTQIALDSIEVAARFFAEHPEGVHPDLAQSAVLAPFLKQVEGEGRFEELIGEAGDLAIIHPCTFFSRGVSVRLKHCSRLCLCVVCLRRYDAPQCSKSLRPCSIRTIPRGFPQDADGL